MVCVVELLYNLHCTLAGCLSCRQAAVLQVFKEADRHVGHDVGMQPVCACNHREDRLNQITLRCSAMCRTMPLADRVKEHQYEVHMVSHPHDGILDWEWVLQ